jgi:hypothetical protein
MSKIAVGAKELNNSLWELYGDVIKNIYDSVKTKNTELSDKQKATNPLLIHVSDEYVNADVRLMVFGQETNNWWGTFGEDDTVEKMMDYLISGDGDNDGYLGFFSEKNCYSYGGQFWPFVKKFIGDLQSAHNGKNISYLWNNVLKLGLGRNNPGTTPYWYENIIKPYFNRIILQEIDILKPDFLVFLSGPNYDTYINDIFGNPQKKAITGFNENELCEFTIPTVKKAVRTYHPAFLYRNNPERPYDDFITAMVNDLSNTIIE